MNESRFWFPMLTAIIALLGCASPSRAPVTRTVLQFDEAEIFAAGDCFRVVLRGKEFKDFTVSEDGTIALPLVSERIKVAGLTPREVAKVISKAFRPDGASEGELEILPCEP
jgi:protein involved in polysaccharide export with SLBB domain